MRTLDIGHGYIALIDDDDFEAVSAFKWHAKVKHRTDGTIRNVYAQRTYRHGDRYVNQTLHRFILGLSDPKILADHINHDGLDCRRENLRTATLSQNTANSRKRLGCKHRFKGVAYHKRDKLWEARIMVDGRIKWLGSFRTEEDAGAAYLKAATELYGEFVHP